MSGIAIFISCSSEQDAQMTAEPAALTEGNFSEKRIYKGDLDDFITDYYHDTYTYGDSIVAYDSNGSYMVKEIFVGTDIRPRGYIVNSTIDREPLHFADIDRTNHVMRTIDMQTEESDVVEDLDLNPVYNEVGGDFLEIIDEGNKHVATGWFVWVGWVFTMDNFWGSDAEYGPCHSEEIGGTFIQVQDITVTKRRFWIVWSDPVVHENIPC